MGQPKKKQTAAQKAAKKKRQQEFMTIFIGGKQKRVRRPVTIDGMDVDEFIRRNADALWLHQNEMWEDIDPHEFDYLMPEPLRKYERAIVDGKVTSPDDREIPF